MSASPLDRPVWSALTGPQARLATRLGDAVRIDPAIGFFAACAGGTAASDDLGMLMFKTEQQSWLLEAGPVQPPRGLTLRRTASLTQMIAESSVFEEDSEAAEIFVLGDDDAADMFALARATQPGPWESATHRYGGYYGIRESGRLVAMAGTRLRPSAQLAEVSGVCTDPAARGRGYARKLMVRVMRDMADLGETPFLHCYSSNEGAMALYRTLGFTVRRELVVSVLEVEQSGG